MEQHPVPRNITGFQFRLIGDMTLRQFGYLLSGVIIGIIIIKLPFPVYISWPVGITFIGAGIAFAFVPIQERPLDCWFAAFIRSIYSPTQFIWRKENVPPAILLQTITKTPQKAKRLTRQHAQNYNESRQKLNRYLASLPKNPREAVDTEEAKKLATTLSLFNPKLQSAPAIAQQIPKPNISKPQKHAPFMTIDHVKKEKKPPLVVKKQPTKKEPPKPKEPQNNETKKISEQTQGLTEQIRLLQKQLSNQEATKERFQQLTKQLSELLSEKDRLTKELTNMKNKMSGKVETEAIRPTTFKQATKEQKETVKIIRPNIAKTAGFPSIPNVPNIISGIIKDGQGTLLPNILITIRDKNRTPVRALKTNKLGQFAASTPLPKGTYTIEIEDPQKRYHFVIIEMTLTDDLVTPLEIIAKSEKEIHRDRLMQEIFGKK